jgi:predicted transcriptional regulator
MSKIRTYFGFKNGKLVSVLQSVKGEMKKALDCNYYITEPQNVEKQIEKWKKENSE